MFVDVVSKFSWQTQQHHQQQTPILNSELGRAYLTTVAFTMVIFSRAANGRTTLETYGKAHLLNGAFTGEGRQRWAGREGHFDLQLWRGGQRLW